MEDFLHARFSFNIAYVSEKSREIICMQHFYAVWLQKIGNSNCTCFCATMTANCTLPFTERCIIVRISYFVDMKVKIYVIYLDMVTHSAMLIYKCSSICKKKPKGISKL